VLSSYWFINFIGYFPIMMQFSGLFGITILIIYIPIFILICLVSKE